MSLNDVLLGGCGQLVHAFSQNGESIREVNMLNEFDWCFQYSSIAAIYMVVLGFRLWAAETKTMPIPCDPLREHGWCWLLVFRLLDSV